MSKDQDGTEADGRGGRGGRAADSDSGSDPGMEASAMRRVSKEQVRTRLQGRCKHCCCHCRRCLSPPLLPPRQLRTCHSTDCACLCMPPQGAEGDADDNGSSVGDDASSKASGSVAGAGSGFASDYRRGKRYKKLVKMLTSNKAQASLQRCGFGRTACCQPCSGAFGCPVTSRAFAASMRLPSIACP
jgi:hypothetical protein